MPKNRVSLSPEAVSCAVRLNIFAQIQKKEAEAELIKADADDVDDEDAAAAQQLRKPMPPVQPEGGPPQNASDVRFKRAVELIITQAAEKVKKAQAKRKAEKEKVEAQNHIMCSAQNCIHTPAKQIRAHPDHATQTIRCSQCFRAHNATCMQVTVGEPFKCAKCTSDPRQEWFASK